MPTKINQRVKEFLECLGNGKDIYQCEMGNNRIDEELKAPKPKNKIKIEIPLPPIRTALFLFEHPEFYNNQINYAKAGGKL